jgi:hypothetical protein
MWRACWQSRVLICACSCDPEAAERIWKDCAQTWWSAI